MYAGTSTVVSYIESAAGVVAGGRSGVSSIVTGILFIAALFVAGPMWRMKLLTVPDFFRRQFGSAAELISSLILVPSYFGWIAAQFTALAKIAAR